MLVMVVVAHSFITSERPAYERIGVTVAHVIFRFKIVDDLHVFL